MFMHVFPAREMVPVRLLHYLEEAVYMDLLPSLETGEVKAAPVSNRTEVDVSRTDSALS